jgi:hypothetical protein
VPVSCLDGYTCRSFELCDAGAPAESHHCRPRACVVDEDCGECGYCVGALCAGQLGLCDLGGMIALPYGCVWPDEELV